MSASTLSSKLRASITKNDTTKENSIVFGSVNSSKIIKKSRPPISFR